jgi:glycosyltransferase involved in cell wall biosynthesis
MRILFINSIGSKKWGGGEKWMLMAASGLQRRGHEVLIGCALNSIIEKKALEIGLRTVKISFSTDFDVPGFVRLIRILKEHKIEFLICGQNKDTKIGAVAARCAGNVTVLARHGLQLIKKKLKYKYIFTKMIDGIITNSYSIKNEYDTFEWFDEKFVKVIFNGFTPPDNIPTLDLHVTYQIPPGALAIISTGRLAKQKGYEILIETAIKAKRENKNWYFIIVGKGKLEHKLKNLVKEFELEKNVILTGFLDDVLPLVKASDIFVLPSWYEGMPNSVMEAMGMGKCCVVTSVNGNNELIINGEEGLLVPPGDASAIYNAIEIIADDHEKREAIGRNAAQRIKDLFDEERMVNELEAFLIEKRKSKV